MNHRALLLATASTRARAVSRPTAVSLVRAVALASTLLLGAVPAVAQQTGVPGEARIDARLRFQTRYGAPPWLAAPPSTTDARAALRVRAADLAAAAEVRAIVRLAPGDAAQGRAALERHGARIATVAGDVVTATLPVSALDALAQEPAVVFIEAAAWLHAPMPAATAFAGAVETESADDAQLDIVRQYTGTGFDGATGAGVIVGIYDSGVDLAHDDFLDDAGRTRVLYAWDQTVDGAPPGAVGASLFDYGYECTSAVIDAQACPLRDNNGHGTHVAGIAAGDGSATGNGLPARRFIGAAPEADLIVVKGGDGGYTSDRVLDGVAYIFERAAALGRPAVVNVSLGTQSGPHDGSTTFERGLQNLLGEGRVIVAAAGNQGNNENEVPAFVRQSLHAMGDVDDGAGIHELVVPAYTPQSGMVNDAAVLELWYDGDDDVAVAVRAPSGALVAQLLPGDSIIASSPEGAVFIDNAARGVDPNNGDRLALITIFDADPNAPPASGAWRIEVQRTGGTGTGEYHLWLVGSNLSSQVELPTLRLGTTNTHLVALPGTADRLITVGAHVARHSWLGPGSEVQNYPFQEQRGDLAHFSSPGPRRDGVLGLDLTAPGKVVVSARSRDAQLWTPLPSFIEADGQHATLFGTSMATPYVTGTVALLMQYAPQLTPEQARTLLIDGARSDEFTARTYSDLPPGLPGSHWGYGKLDAAAALHALPIAGGTFATAASALPVQEHVAARVGARTALLQLTLEPDSVEAVHLQSLAFTLNGDAAGTLMIVEDVDGDGTLDDDEPAVASMPVDFAAQSQVRITTDAVAARDTLTRFLVAVTLAPGTQHAAQFAVTLDPLASMFVGALSGDVNAWTEPPAAAGSPLLAASVLAPDERWSLSENPVRSGHVVLNFAEPARAVRIYTLAGHLVRDLPVAQGTERIEWRLDNNDGALVASGVYLLLVEFADASVTDKLMVLR